MKVKSITTAWDNRIRNTTEEIWEAVTDTERENEIINLYPDVTYQKLEGFGGAATDSAGYVFSLMEEKQKQQMLEFYFGKEGMHYNQVRIPIDSFAWLITFTNSGSQILHKKLALTS